MGDPFRVDAPRRGNERLAQGIALGKGVRQAPPLKGQKPVYKGIALVCHHLGRHPDITLLPFQGEGRLPPIPRAMPWAKFSLPLRGDVV